MVRSPRLQMFSLLFGAAYLVCFYYNWALFRYYPINNEFSFSALPPKAGPAIMWYGWMAIAALVGIVGALIVPRRFAERLQPSWSWIVPILTLLAVFVYEKRWFF